MKPEDKDKHIIDKINKEYSYFYKFTRKASNWYGTIAIIIEAILIFVCPGKERIVDLFIIILRIIFNFFNISITKENVSTALTWGAAIGCIIMYIVIYFIIKLLVYIFLKIITKSDNPRRSSLPEFPNRTGFPDTHS